MRAKAEKESEKKILLLQAMLNAIAQVTNVHCVTLALTIASSIAFRKYRSHAAIRFGQLFGTFIQRKENVCFSVHNRQPPKRPLSKVTSGKSRKFSSTYRLKDEYGTEQVECKYFFFATLGFHQKMIR